MNNASEDQKLFKLILGALASEDLSREDYRAALESLRDGEMILVLDKLLTVLSKASTGPKQNKDRVTSRDIPRDKKGSSRAESNKRPDELFDDVKRRKITRERLESMIASLDRQFLMDQDRPETMRGLISAFRRSASDRQWALLSSIVNGDYEVDPYFEDTK